MRDHEKEYLAPCIVNEGTIINKRDMMRALRIYENVAFEDYVDGELMASSEGVMVDVFQCDECSSLFLKGAIFINVMSFNYLQLEVVEEKTNAKLVNKFRTIKISPIGAPAKIVIEPDDDHIIDSLYDETFDEPHLLHEEPFEEED